MYIYISLPFRTTSFLMAKQTTDFSPVRFSKTFDSMRKKSKRIKWFMQ